MPLPRHPYRPIAYIPRASLAIAPQGWLEPTAVDGITSDIGIAYAGEGPISFSIKDKMFHHYYHTMETLLVLYVCQMEFGLRQPTSAIYFPSSKWNNPTQHLLQSHILPILFPGITVVDNPHAYPADVAFLFRYDRTQNSAKFGIVFEPWMPSLQRHMPDIRRLVKQGCGVPVESAGSGNRPSIVYVTRKPPRCLPPADEATLLAGLRELGHVTVADFATMTWEQQVTLCASQDVIVGVHGNGLTNLLWLREGATVIELFPLAARVYCYQFLAEICGFPYYGIDGDLVLRDGQRHGRPTPPGAVRTPVLGVNIRNILDIVAAAASRLTVAA